MSDGLPPHSIDAERGLLGCILIDAKLCAPQVAEAFPDTDGVCYGPQNAILLRLMLMMNDNGEPVDMFSVIERLRTQNRLDEAGGLEYISKLQDATPSSHNVQYFIDTVREKMLLRHMLYALTNGTNLIYGDQTGEVEDVLDTIEKQILAVRMLGAKSSVSSMEELVPQVIQRMDDCHARAGQLTGLGTGIEDLDRMTGGLQNGEMIVLAARPSVGKSSLAMNIAEHVALVEKLAVGVFSLEMPKISLAMRSLCTIANVNSRDITTGQMADRDLPKITSAASKLRKAKIYIEDTSGLSVMQLRAKARRMKQQYDIRLLVVDYLQLLIATMNGRRISNRQQEITEISSGIKSLSRDLGIPVLVLSQINREVEKEKRRPNLSDLRESGSIEQDADGVMFLYNEEIEEGAVPNIWQLMVNLYLAKQRNGPTGDVYLEFCKPMTKFIQRPKIEPEDVPPPDQQYEPEPEFNLPHARD